MTLAAAALAGAACGGDGDEGADEGAPATTQAQAPAAVPETGVAPEPAAPSSGAVDACALISPAEAAAALGAPDATPWPGPPIGGSVLGTCSWTPAVVDGAVAPGTIAFGVYEGEGSYAPDMVASDMRPVDGLGDRAAISPGTGIVQWVQGERTYQLQFALAGDASEAAMETLARQASARIG